MADTSALMRPHFIWDGNLTLLASLYKDTTTKRRFRFYGVVVGWLMIGVTVASTHSLARGPAEP